MQDGESVPTSPLERRRTFLKLLIEQKSAAFSEFTRIISVIEGKAEKTAVSAGALIGLGVPLLIRSEIPPAARVPVNCVLFLAIVLLITAFGFCLFVAWVRQVAPPPQLGEMQRLLGYVLMLKDEELTEQVELGVYKEQSDYWEAALESYGVRANQKGTTLQWAQGFLAAGVCVLAAAVLMILMASFMPVR